MRIRILIVLFILSITIFPSACETKVKEEIEYDREICLEQAERFLDDGTVSEFYRIHRTRCRIEVMSALREQLKLEYNKREGGE